MKQTSTQRVRVSLRLCLGLFLTIVSVMFSQSSSAHNVRYYTPPCFLAGATVTVPVVIANAAQNSWFHWQYRTSTSGAWTYLSTGTNSINGRNFTVTNASFAVTTANNSSGTGAFLAPALSIANIGSPSYTTELNDVQLRVLMTDGLDPQTHTVDTWGGEEFLNPIEAKYVTLRASSSTTTCAAICNGNPLLTGSTFATNYGSFEIGSGQGTENFATANATTGATIATPGSLTQWLATGGAIANNQYRVMNNPDSMDHTNNKAFAPHTGTQMMVINHVTAANTAVWTRTTVTPSNTTFFSGSLSFKIWIAKTRTDVNPTITLDVVGAPDRTLASPFSSTPIATAVTSTFTGATAGIWQQVTYTASVPAGTYKKIQYRVRVSAGAYLALDDICLLEPSGGPLPIVLTPLKGSYANGVSNLTWSTLQESNSSYFAIERSTDGITYNTIGNNAAKGVSDKQTNYAFNDIKVNPGTNYYRLKLVDKDGDYQYSNIVALTASIKGTTVTGVYPNPFTDKVNVAVSSEVTAQANISLFDNAGKLLARQVSTVNKGANNIVLQNLDNLAKGFYMIKIQVGDVVTTQKLIK